MELDIAEELSALEDVRPDLSDLIEIINTGRHYYSAKKYVVATEYFSKACVALNDARYSVDKVPPPEWLTWEAQYWLYKAAAMSAGIRDEHVRLPINFVHLERLVAERGRMKDDRAVRMHVRFGKLGLRLHDWLERRGL